MSGETAASIANMPLRNIVAFGVVAVFVFAMILVIIVVTFRLMKKSGIAKAGPIEFQREIEEHQEKEHKGASNQHYMDDDIKKLDEICKTKCRIVTNKLKSSLVHRLREFSICMMGRRAIASATRFPLYEAVANNHFTSVLMPDMVKEYRDGLIGEIEQEYIQIYDDHLDAPCPSTAMPAWEELRPMAIAAIDTWLKHIAAKVSETSRLKIEIYLKYRPMFEAEGDRFRVGICDACIAKNRDYIRELDRIMG